MSIVFSMTARDLVKRAMQARRVLALGRDPTATELEYGLERLDQMLKTLVADGVNPWTDMEESITFSAGESVKELDPRPGGVMAANLQLTTYERPLTRWETGEYNDLPNKTQTGDPLIYTIHETPDAVSMIIWPVPTASKTINYRYVRVLEDVDASTVIDVPQAWLEGIEAMLAIRLSAFAMNNPDLPALAAMHETRLYDLSRPENYIIVSDMYA